MADGRAAAADEGGAGAEQDRNSVRVMASVLDADPPDLVVLNGDLVNGDSTFKENSTHYIDQIVAPMVERRLSWASTYGNHDHAYNLDAGLLLEREQSLPGARTAQMVATSSSGITNYYLPVFAPGCSDAADDACVPELLLWFFDSRGGFYFQGDTQPDWVDASVVAWFASERSSLARRYGPAAIPSLAFVHIPTNATNALQAEAGVDAHRQPGINEEPPIAKQAADWCPDGSQNGCAYGGQDVPFMQALVDTDGLVALFSGHDHGNTWCYKWDSLLPGMTVAGNGLNLCYGQHTGYGGYGDWVRGARQIVASRDQLRELAVDTHIRLETGDVVGAVTLNATYNRDAYPATPNLFSYMARDPGANFTVKLASAPLSRSVLARRGAGAAVSCLGIWILVHGLL